MRFYVFVYFFLFVNLTFLHSGEAPIKKCDEAKVQGACSDMVQTAINVCEDKQSGKDITAKRLRDAKESKMGTGSNFAELEAKYKRLEDSARTDAQNQKACYEAATALKKDCVDYCDDNDKNGSSCNKSLYSLDQIRNFCKKNEEEAEEVAEVAAEDARMLGGTSVDTGGTGGSGGTTGGGTTGAPITPPTVTPKLGYTGQGDLGAVDSGANASETADAIKDAILGSGSGGGTSGGGTTGGGGAASLGNDGNALGSAGSGKKVNGTGLTGGDSSGSGRSDKSGGSTPVTGKSEGAPGYMFWGVPPKKKKPPLTLLSKPKDSKSKSSQSNSSVSNKKPTQNNQTQVPSSKE